MVDEVSVVSSQSEQYRRGQVLGFTMAEIMLVLLFLLLILLGDQISDLQVELDESIQPGTPEAKAVILVKEALGALETAGLTSPEEDIVSLTEKLTLAAPETIQQLPSDELIKRLESERDQLTKENAELEKQTEELMSQVGQSPEAQEKFLQAKDLQQMAELGGLKHESAMMCLEGCGGGDGPEACWGESIQNPDYIYSIAMLDDQFYVVPDIQNIEKNQRSWDEISENAKISGDAILSKTEFSSIFKRLRAYSDRNDCKFQVRLFDYATTTKEIYKSQERLVERYVYKTPRLNWPYGDISATGGIPVADLPSEQPPTINKTSGGNPPAESGFLNSAPTSSAWEPKLVRSVPPKYPRRAASREIEGSCTVEYFVTPSGDVTNAIVIESECLGGYFEKSALEAIEQYQYQPYTSEEGYPQTKVLRKTFTFKLE